MTTYSFLSDASWFFFSLWTAAVFTVGIAAFGRDLLPLKAEAGTKFPKDSSK